MKKNNVFLMNRLIRCAVTGEKLSDDVALGLTDNALTSIYGLSKFYDLIHIVDYALVENGVKVPTELAAKFKRQRMVAIFRYVKIDFQTQLATETLEAAKIPFVLLKGAVIRKYYPEPWMRTSADIDILVDKDNLEAATSALTEKLGFQSRWYSGHDVSLYSDDDDVHIELHHTLSDENIVTKYNDVLSDVSRYIVRQEEKYEAELTDAMFYFYHIAHAAKHLKNGGCGVRPLLDLWLIDRNMKINEAEKRELLEKGGLSELASALERLSEIWYGDAEHDEVTEKIEDFIFAGGKYGGLENRAKVADENGKKRGIFSKIFKPYDELKFWYPRLNGRKWLLPFYQVKRWCRILFGGAMKKNAEERKLKEKVDASPNDEAAELLKKLGI